MKVSLPKIEEGFRIIPHDFCGINSYLITPSLNPIWTTDNLYFRSIIVSEKLNTVLSCGFKKFFNDGEKPSLYPNINLFSDVYAETKHDGTLVIVDYCKDQFSMRTRGTASYKAQKNFTDFELLPQRYPKILEICEKYNYISFLFELETPNNVIVIRPETIKFTFLGGINKQTLANLTNEEISEFSKLMEIDRPRQYKFDNLSDLSLIVKEWKGKEGLVLSYNNHQNKIKLKSDWYNFVHRIKSQLNSDNNLLELYLDKQMPSHNDFFNIIETEFDFEIANQLETQIKKLCEAGDSVKKYIDNTLEIIHDIRKVETRKQQAEMITRNFKENSSIAFSILDNKQLSKIQLIKLIKAKMLVDI
jgi:hypothetical protein